MEKRKGRIFILMILAILVCLKPNIAHAASYTVAHEYDGLSADIKANCVAFARYKVPSLPGGLYTLEDKMKYINSYTARAGVIAITKGNSSAGHVAYVESVSGNQITTLNGGFDTGIYIERITGTESEQGILGYWYPSNITSDTQPPTISNIDISDLTRDGYTVTCTVSDNVGIASVKFPSWNIDINGGGDAIWLEGTLNGNTVSVRVNISDLKSGAREGYYMTHIYAYDTSGNCTSAPINNEYPLLIDRTSPTISDVSVRNITRNGYTVRCKVSDNVEHNITRVQFPTWTELNGQDDIVEAWNINSKVSGTHVGDGYYEFQVNIDEHNNERGIYHTHIYAFDRYGNEKMYGPSDGMPDIVVPESDDITLPVVLGKEITYTDEETAHIKITASDNVELGKLESCIPAYSDYIKEELPINGVYEFDWALRSGNPVVCNVTLYDKAGNSTSFKMLLGEPEKEFVLKVDGAAYDIEKIKEAYLGTESESLYVCYYEDEFLKIENQKIIPLKTGVSKCAFSKNLGVNLALYLRIVDHTTVTLNKGQLTLQKVGDSETLTAEVAPINTIDKTVTWSSSNYSVATVDLSGKVTAVGKGTSVITATSREDGQIATCTVNVMASNTNNSTEPGNTTDIKNAEQETITITFDANGGTNLSRRSVTLKKNQMIGNMPSVQRKGYYFKGWYTEKTSGVKMSHYARITKSQTLYARWEKVAKPKKVIINSLKKQGKGKFQLKYKKIAGVNGYEISYSTNKKFKSSTKKVNTTSLSKKVTKLKKNKTYYVRVRAYKVDSTGSKVYGSYSKAKKVKV